ncbi:MAG: phosphotransferase family protein [Caulobacterales bacterium]
MARLADGRMAWFPVGDEAREAMRKECRILGLIEARCTFRAPRVLHVSPAGWDLRQPVPGRVSPSELYHRIAADDGLARRLGADIGAALAEQHGLIGTRELAGWLNTEAGWPMPRSWLDERLPRTGADGRLLRRVARMLDAYFALTCDDPVLTHGDLGLHNIAVDASDGSLAGVFDYDGAALADRCHDFKYLLFDRESESMLDGALSAYEPALSVRLDRRVIRLMNAACAIGFLAFRDGHAPQENWCGRTLEEDLRWTDLALSRAGF